MCYQDPRRDTKTPPGSEHPKVLINSLESIFCSRFARLFGQDVSHSLLRGTGYACPRNSGRGGSGTGLRVSGFGFKSPGSGLRVWGFGVWGVGFRISGFGCRVRRLGFRDSGFGCRVPDSKIRESDFGSQVSHSEVVFRIQGLGLRDSGSGIRISGSGILISE